LQLPVNEWGSCVVVLAIQILGDYLKKNSEEELQNLSVDVLSMSPKRANAYAELFRYAKWCETLPLSLSPS
jgi:hypothetical protein